MLEARPQSCFSNRFLLTLDDEPLGSYDLHRFGRRARIRLTSGERMRFERKGWTGFRVHLLDEWTDAVLAEGGPRLLGRTWDLRLSIGPARLQWCGRVCDESGSIASTEVSGPLWRGWRVHAVVGLSLADLIFLGMAYSERFWWRPSPRGGAMSAF